MFEVGVVEEFKAVLSLKGDFGAATRVHGHDYRVQVTVNGDRLDDTGVLCDISRLRETLKGILSHLHYQNLNELEEFSETNPTVENLCRHIYDKMVQGLGQQSRGMKVIVWESATAFASYWEEQG